VTDSEFCGSASA